MVARTLAPVAMALLVFSACKGSGETEKKVPDAAPLQSSQSLSPAPASASASRGAVSTSAAPMIRTGSYRAISRASDS